MAAKTVVILGGGWGGLAAAHDLRGLLPDEDRILVVERSETFALGLSNLWLMTGERAHPSDVRRDMSKLARSGIEWVHDEVVRIDPETRTIELTAGALTSDYLVIALGAERSLGAVPGLAASAYNLYDATSAAELHHALLAFSGGHLVALVAGTPFSCPAAPYEAVLLMDDVLRRTGVRGGVDIRLYTPEPQPMPVAGPLVGERLAAMLAERDIAYHPLHAVTSVDAGLRAVRFAGAEPVPFDLLVAVPRHSAPRVIAEAALTDTSGYIPVHPQTLEILSDVETLETQYPGVFAIGDVTSIQLFNSKFLPKAGIFVEAQARVVATNIAAEIRGERPRARFDGRGFCYIEVGDQLAAYGSGNFYAYPDPIVNLEPPSHEHRTAKEQFERVLETWFH
jgi:sulfide:quinone oxidoreductase